MTGQWLTASEAAHLLNIKSTATIKRAYEDGVFGDMAIMVGNQLRFNPAMFQSADAAARASAITEMAQDLIRRANALAELAQDTGAPPARRTQRRGLTLIENEPTQRQHAGD